MARSAATRWKRRQPLSERFANSTPAVGTTSVLLTTATAPIAEIVGVCARCGNAERNFRKSPACMWKALLFHVRRAGAQRAEFIINPEPAAVSRVAGIFGRDQTHDAGSGIAGRAGARSIDFALLGLK